MSEEAMYSNLFGMWVECRKYGLANKARAARTVQRTSGKCSPVQGRVG